MLWPCHNPVRQLPEGPRVACSDLRLAFYSSEGSG